MFIKKVLYSTILYTHQVNWLNCKRNLIKKYEAQEILVTMPSLQ